MKLFARHSDKAGSSPWQLGYWRVFPRHLERLYEAETVEERNRRSRLMLMLGIALQLAGLPTDYGLGPEAFGRSATITTVHFILSAILIWHLTRPGPVLLQEVMLTFVNAIGAFASLYIGSVVEAPYNYLYYMNAGFYSIAVNFAFSLRLLHAVWNTVAIGSAYIFFVQVLIADGDRGAGGPSVEDITQIVGISIFLTIIIALQNERSRRQAFLADLRVRRAQKALVKANDKLNELLRVDALTGVRNRRAFDELLLAGVIEQRAKADRLGVIVLDVDHFKSYNDMLGHQSGDECLQKVAECLAEHVRPGDVVFRYGGEEFVVVLTDGVTAEVVGTAAERLRAAVERMALPHPREDGAVVTISAGAVAMVPTAGVAGEDFVRLADEALYASKREGRNRVTCIDGPGAALMAITGAAVSVEGERPEPKIAAA